MRIPFTTSSVGLFVLEAITEIARMSLMEGVIPLTLKPVWVTPIWKESDKEEATNYWPISITDHLLKVVGWNKFFFSS